MYLLGRRPNTFISTVGNEADFADVFRVHSATTIMPMIGATQNFKLHTQTPEKYQSAYGIVLVLRSAVLVQTGEGSKGVRGIVASISVPNLGRINEACEFAVSPAAFPKSFPCWRLVSYR
jgi:hypothetical protein